MTANLQTLISSAQKLSFFEQIELLRAVSQFLSQSYDKELPQSDFWQLHTIDEMVQIQQAKPIQDISVLQVDFWPEEEETADDFIEYIYQQRQEDSLRT